jgi:hypothetical protein
VLAQRMQALGFLSSTQKKKKRQLVKIKAEINELGNNRKSNSVKK